jgi:exopolysaccharide biosynthesis polyprenyl glycosylphosphotransferase
VISGCGIDDELIGVEAVNVTTDRPIVEPGVSVAACGAVAASGYQDALRQDLPRSDRGIVRPPRSIPNAKTVALLDTVVAVASLLLVLLWTNREQMPYGLDNFLALRITLKNVLLLGAFVAAWSPIFRLHGLYDAHRTRRLDDELGRLALACIAGTLLALPIALTSESGAFGPNSVVHFWVVAIATSSCVRVARRIGVQRQRQRSARRVLIVGSGARARKLYGQLSADNETIYKVVGFVDDANGESIGGPELPKALGTLNQLEDILMHEPLDELFVALPIKSHYHAVQEVITICERVGVRVTYFADIFGCSLAQPRYSDSMGSPVVTMHTAPEDERLLLKRAIDLLGASVALTAFMPVMLAAATVVKLTSPGPVIFAQERYGLNKRRFKMYKFRTMVVDAESLQARLESRNEVEGPVFKIKSDPRLTSVGRILRKTSIDEMPQLINVIRGEMSLVGPRPLPLRDVQRFTRPMDMRRFSVRPGLTCLWQISGRSNLPFSEWIRLDLAYIDHWSLALDLRILIKTFPAVFKGTGAS